MTCVSRHPQQEVGSFDLIGHVSCGSKIFQYSKTKPVRPLLHESKTLGSEEGLALMNTSIKLSIDIDGWTFKLLARHIWYNSVWLHLSSSSWMNLNGSEGSKLSDCIVHLLGLVVPHNDVCHLDLAYLFHDKHRNHLAVINPEAVDKRIFQ